MRVFEFLRKNQTAIQNWADVISKVAQVLALVLAGIWTYKTFYESEKPGLEARLNTSCSVAWTAIPDDSDACEATLDVTVENSGKQPVDVTSMQIAGWISGSAPMKSKTPQFITSDDLKRGEKFFDDKNVKSPLLLGHFPPGTSRTDSFVWYFRKEQTKVATWEVNFKTSKDVRFGTKNYEWDYVCRGL